MPLTCEQEIKHEDQEIIEAIRAMIACVGDGPYRRFINEEVFVRYVEEIFDSMEE